MEFLKPLEPLNVSSANVYSEWRDWCEEFELYNLGSGLSSKDEKQQVSAMVCMMGKHAVKLFKTMKLAEGKSKEKIKDVIEGFEEHFKSRSTKSSLRQVFMDRRQKAGESLLDFVESVQQLALTAGYKLPDNETVVTDTIVRGCQTGLSKLNCLILEMK